MNDTFPTYRAFEQACLHGLSTVRPLACRSGGVLYHDWDFAVGYPPSYWSYGRMRVLHAIATARNRKPVRLLEVAAGDAGLSAVLAEDGCDVWANDLRADHLQAAIARFSNATRIRVLPGDLFALSAEHTGTFDLIVACEIIEHVAHTVPFLQHLKSFLKPGGSILLTTPNGAYFRNKLPTWSQIEDFVALESEQFKPDADGHLFLLTPEEVDIVAARAGLKVIAADLWATPIITGHAGLRLIGGRWAIRPCYEIERLSRGLPYKIRRKISFALSVLLQHE